MSEGGSVATTDRATCWSITVNNPTPEDISPNLPASWKLEGQIEKGVEGTEHFQGMLLTPQVRFSTVKNHFPRAHIEICRNRTALQAYVHKTETRVREVNSVQGLTVFKLQDQVLTIWNTDDFEQYQKLWNYADDCYLRYADNLVRTLISRGTEGGIEYVAINPMWRTAWKKFGESIVTRYFSKNIIYNEDAPSPFDETSAEAQYGES